MLYQVIQNVLADLDQNPSPLEEYDPYTSPVWAIDTPNIHDISYPPIFSPPSAAGR